MGCWNATLTMWPPAAASRIRDWAHPKTDQSREADLPAVLPDFADEQEPDTDAGRHDDAHHRAGDRRGHAAVRLGSG